MYWTASREIFWNFSERITPCKKIAWQTDRLVAHRSTLCVGADTHIGPYRGNVLRSETIICRFLFQHLISYIFFDFSSCIFPNVGL